jgi:hypothetical protein
MYYWVWKTITSILCYRFYGCLCDRGLIQNRSDSPITSSKCCCWLRNCQQCT